MIEFTIGFALFVIGAFLVPHMGIKIKGLTMRTRLSIGILIGLMLSMYLMLMGISDMSKQKAYTEALKGNNPYEMRVRYEIKDSISVPVDTVYILKNFK